VERDSAQYRDVKQLVRADDPGDQHQGSAAQIYTHMTDAHLRDSYNRFHPRARAVDLPDPMEDPPKV
jgi:site-specific recombinase XerC